VPRKSFPRIILLFFKSTRYPQKSGSYPHVAAFFHRIINS